jgi:hypothetical protein
MNLLASMHLLIHAFSFSVIFAFYILIFNLTISKVGCDPSHQLSVISESVFYVKCIFKSFTKLTLWFSPKSSLRR